MGFAATGVYNQFVSVTPSSGSTIVKLSGHQKYETSGDKNVNRDMEGIAFLQALADAVYFPIDLEVLPNRFRGISVWSS